MSEYTPMIIIISGPSGVGKSSVISALLKKRQDMVFSISYTTRAMRDGEEDGVNYFFISKSEFAKKVADGEIIEYTMLFDNYYGTSATGLMNLLQKGKSVICDVDENGAENIAGFCKDKIDNKVVKIWLTADKHELEHRLASRGGCPLKIQERIMSVDRCTRDVHQKYDRIVHNKDIVITVDDIEEIVKCL